MNKKAKTKEYQLTSNHRLPNGRVMRAGEMIRLSAASAAGLSNKIIDPNQVIVNNESSEEQAARIVELTNAVDNLKSQLEKRESELTAEIEELKRKIPEKETASGA